MAAPTESESLAGSGTGAGLLAFLDWAVEKNQIVEASGVALRVGTKRVLETDEDLFQQDVRAIDVESVIQRFHIKHRGGKLNDDSREDYARRFKSSIAMYSKWLAGDPSWRPAVRRTQSRVKATDNGAQPKTGRPSAPAPAQTVVATVMDSMPVSAPLPGVPMVTYPYPVRPGLMAEVRLPADLTAREAERVAKFVASLAFDERSAITAELMTE